MTNSPTQGRPWTTNAPPWEHNTRQMLGREGTRHNNYYWLSYCLTNHVNRDTIHFKFDDDYYTVCQNITNCQQHSYKGLDNHLDNHIPLIYNIIYCLSLWTKC